MRLICTLAFDQGAKFVRCTLLFTILLSSGNVVLAQAVHPLSGDQSAMLARLTPLFPNGMPDPEQPEISNPTKWEIRVWSTNEAEECSYENKDPACRGHTLYVTVSDDNLGGRTFGFRTRKAFKWIVMAISEKPSEDKKGACALIVIRERFAAKDKSHDWQHRDVTTCVSPTGFQR
jgi:hypothetical protein